MPDMRRNIYWDACVFLSYINGMADRVPILDALLESSSSPNGNIKLFTSNLSKVEVAFATTEREQRSLDSDIEEKIDGLWDDPDAIVTVEMHHTIAMMARGLMRSGMAAGLRLRPPDSIHLATAEWLSSSGIVIDEFHTYDDRLRRCAPIVSFNLVEPYTPQPNLL